MSKNVDHIKTKIGFLRRYWALIALYLAFGCNIIFNHHDNVPWYKDEGNILFSLTLISFTFEQILPQKFKVFVAPVFLSVVLLLFAGRIYYELQKYGFANAFSWVIENWYAVLALLWLPIMFLIWLFFERRGGQLKIKE